MALELLDGESFSTISGDSMEHDPDGMVGVVDDRDGVVITDANEYTTYFEGRARNKIRLGDFGDVVAFRVNGGDTRFVHRLVLYMKYNHTTAPATVDVPELGYFNITSLVVEDYGFDSHTFLINFSNIYVRMADEGRVVLKGFITKGDNRRFVDQEAETMFVSPVPEDDILGVCSVVDNEMIRRDLPAYLSMLLPLVMFLMLYAVWFGLKHKGGTPPSHKFGTGMVLAVALLLPLIYIVGLIRSSGLSTFDAAAGVVGYLVLCVIITGVGFLGRKTASKNIEKSLIPLMFPILLTGAFFILKSNVLLFSQSIIYILVVNYLFQMDPGKVLDDVNWKAKIGNWGLWFVPGIIFFLAVVTITIPPYVYLAAGWGVGNIYLVSTFYQRYKSLKTDIVNE